MKTGAPNHQVRSPVASEYLCKNFIQQRHQRMRAHLTNDEYLETAFDSDFAVNSVFGNSYMNFTQFMTPPTLLNKDGCNFEELMHRLMMQQSALQLHFDQDVWGILILMYRGDSTKNLDPSLLSPKSITRRERT